MLEAISEFVHPHAICNHRIFHDPVHEGEHFHRDAHNEWEILFFLQGDATYIIEGKHYKLRPYDLVIIRPSKYHYVQIDGNCDYERYNLYFHSAMVGRELLRALPADLEVINCAESAPICGIFDKIDSYVAFGNSAFLDLLGGLLREIFYNLLYFQRSITASATQISPPLK